MSALSCLGGQRSVSAVSANEIVESPSNYKIVIYDNNSCGIDFYAAVMELVFNFSEEMAYSKALLIKSLGFLELGNFTKDIAETKLENASQFAKKLHLEFKGILIRERGNNVIEEFGGQS